MVDFGMSKTIEISIAKELPMEELKNTLSLLI